MSFASESSRAASTKKRNELSNSLDNENVKPQTEPTKTAKEPTDERIGPQAVAPSKLLHWDELEDWQKDNEYIHTGYVNARDSFKAVVASLGYLHNETGNIYTHLVPSVLVLLLLVAMGVSSLAAPPFLVFYVGVVACLGMSATFHCLKSHSHRISVVGNKLDYLGICILIASSMIALIDFAYDDMPVQRYVFGGITMTLCVACATVSLLEKFRSREYRPTRAAMFVAYGLSGVLPVAVGVLEFGYKETSLRSACPWLYAEAFFYIFGAFLYAIRFPEKTRPGAFDFFGHSHQIFHVFVVVAAWCHYRALQGSYSYALQRKSL